MKELAMRKLFLKILASGMVVLLALAMWGCSNPDEDDDPIVPDPSGPGSTTGPMDPFIPTPFAYNFGGTITDIGIEGDGDIVIAAETGMQLFTPYGVWKKTLTGQVITGIASSNQGNLDTGRGVQAIGPGVANCNPQPYYDDNYVQGGVPHVSYDAVWFAGEPDPYYPDICVNIASTSSFASCDCVPHPISYHPVTNYAYQKVLAPDCIADSDCPWPFTNTVDAGGYAILAYHPDTPLPPDYMSFIFEGNVDYLVYYDYPTFMQVQNLAAMLGVLPACSINNLYTIWDLTSMNYMSSRDGMTTTNICDFEFDTLNRLVMVLPNADSVAITEPVVFGQPIIIQQVLGGRQNGLGTLPGEFQGPVAIAVDPRNQDILVSDAGNGRVQVFDNDGNFKREFGAADPDFTPGAIRVDSFGAIYVANTNGNRAEGDDLRIYNEYGAPVVYGTIEGWVYDKDTHVPIDNASVRVQSTFSPLDAFTDGDGHFQFDAVAAGTHNIVAEKYGYNAGQVNIDVTGGYKTIVDIYLDRVMTEPPGYGTVTGTVFSTLYNEPVPGLTAEIVGLPISNQTNGNGEFTLYSVPEGDHTIRLTSNGIIYYEKYITVTKGGILDLGYLYLPIP